MSQDADFTSMPPIRVAGVGLRGSGYPNAINTLRHLRAAGLNVDDQADWLPEGLHLWKAMRGSLKDKAGLYQHLLLGNAVAAWRLCCTTRRERRITYVPYPSVFLLWWLSWLPRRMRPPLIADAYISIWDSAVRDRGLVDSGRWSDRLLRWFEMRALRVADAVLVDTIANRDWMITEFGLAPGAIFAIPLAIDDEALLALPPIQAGKPLHASFVGTFVPLHGIDVLIEAVKRAQDPDRMLFRFVGDGQEAPKVERAIAQGVAGFTWEKRWQSHDQIIAVLAQSDVSFGVFGGAAKASRVLPFKLYLALAAGRAVITQREFSLPEGVPAPPFMTPRADPDDIATLLLALSNAPSICEYTARAGRTFYQDWLGGRSIVNAWKALLESFQTRLF